MLVYVQNTSFFSSISHLQLTNPWAWEQQMLRAVCVTTALVFSWLPLPCPGSAWHSPFFLNPTCLSHCSIAAMKHHDQGNFKKQTNKNKTHLIGGLLTASEGKVHYHLGREHGGRQADMVLEQ